MSAVLTQTRSNGRPWPFWLIPVQLAGFFTVAAIAYGGQALRAWLLTAITWLMCLPLLVSLEAGLVAMIVFEPLRGIIRRAQYLIVDYSSQDPIHVLTPIVTLIAVISLLKVRRLSILNASPLARWITMLGAIYIVEIFNPLQGGLIVGLSGAMFVLPPLMWFFFGQYVNDHFIRNVARLMVAIGLITSLYGVYQLLFGYPAFEQYWISNTDFYTSIAVGHVERALATFCSAEEWGRYTELGAIAAFGFVFARNRLSIRFGWLMAGLTLTGFVMLTGQRAAVFGLLFGLVVFFMLGANSLPKAFARVALFLIPFALLFILVKPPAADEMWSNDETQTVSTVLEHTQRGVLKPAGEESFQERMRNWSFLLTQVIPYRPLGAGVGAGSLSEWRFSQEDDDLPPIDSSILVHGIACGIPGMLLFLWIIFKGSWFSVRAARREISNDHGSIVKRIVAAILAAVILNSVFGLTFTLYSIAPLVWLFIGWSSAAMVRVNQEERETFII